MKLTNRMAKNSLGGLLVSLLILAFACEAAAQTWTELFPGGPPSARRLHTAVYDPSTNQMIVFGGQAVTGAGPVNDVWVLADANGIGTPAWMELSPTGGPPLGRDRHTAVYDPATNQMIVFGGQTDTVPDADPDNDVWVLADANGIGTPAWTQLTTTGGPFARRSHTAVYDPDTNRMIVFGGWMGILTGTGRVNDVWVLANANGQGGTPTTWTQLTTTGDPPSARGRHTAVYDPATNRMTIFGGITDTGRVNDVWVLADANGIGTPAWMELSPTGGPTGRTK